MSRLRKVDVKIISTRLFSIRLGVESELAEARATCIFLALVLWVRHSHWSSGIYRHCAERPCLPNTCSECPACSRKPPEISTQSSTDAM